MCITYACKVRSGTFVAEYTSRAEYVLIGNACPNLQHLGILGQLEASTVSHNKPEDM